MNAARGGNASRTCVSTSTRENRPSTAATATDSRTAGTLASGATVSV